eukprot:5551873-Alexandrium_andersonii.AAC.1
MAHGPCHRATQRCKGAPGPPEPAIRALSLSYHHHLIIKALGFIIKGLITKRDFDNMAKHLIDLPGPCRAH